MKRVRHFLTVNFAAQIRHTLFKFGYPLDLPEKKGQAVQEWIGFFRFNDINAALNGFFLGKGRKIDLEFFANF